MCRLYLKSFSRTITTLQDKGKDHLLQKVGNCTQNRAEATSQPTLGDGGAVGGGFRQGEGVNFSCHSGRILWSQTVGCLWKV